MPKEGCFLDYLESLLPLKSGGKSKFLIMVYLNLKVFIA